MKVRTTINPDLEIEVDAAEYTDLKRQGLLVGQEVSKSRRADVPANKED